MTEHRGPDPHEDQTPFRYADGSPMRPDEAPTWPPLHVQRRAVTAPLPQIEQTRPAPVSAGDESLAGPGGSQPTPRRGRRVVRATKTAPSRLLHATRRATEAQGAGESGLSRLIEVHALSSAGDAALAVGLAGTVFFAVPNGQARGQVLLFLLLTMLPFAIIAPLVGPLLDRFRRGRRWAIGATLAGRAFLCWVTAQTIEDHSNWLFPCALGVLVLSKAYLVTRSAAAPRLLPSQLTLVKANGRLSLAGVIGAGVGGVLAGGAAKVGPAWSLRVAFVLFVIGTVLAILLPARVDSSEGRNPPIWSISPAGKACRPWGSGRTSSPPCAPTPVCGGCPAS
ncbi:MFS transporter [Branchiibius cervicis]|uniref:MFS transporter n=1 Tax=Branchiibius cervicis TaxID=908252 RepID=A0ABW2AR61_9MICO